MQGTAPLEHVRLRRNSKKNNWDKKLPPEQKLMGKAAKTVESVVIILSHREMTQVSGVVVTNVLPTCLPFGTSSSSAPTLSSILHPDLAADTPVPSITVSDDSTVQLGCDLLTSVA
jgi:hypothetical protein